MKTVEAISIIVVTFCLVLYIFSYNNYGEFLGLNLSSSFDFEKTSSSQVFLADDDDDQTVHDEHYELRKALKGAATEDNTVILTTLNDAWAEPNSLFDLFIESFNIGNNTAWLLDHVLVIAVDEKAYSRCQSSVCHCYFLKSNHSNEMAHEAKFMSAIYLEMMWGRQVFLRTILTLGYNFVYTDTDIMWLRDPFLSFYPDTDFQTSTDDFNGDPFDMDNHPNNGFNFVRSNNRSIEFYNFWIGSRWKYPGRHEQRVFNYIKHDPYIKKIGLKYRFLDTDHFGGFCTPSKDFNKICTIHANCCVGLERKIADLKTILEDWKTYMSQVTNCQTSSIQWRAPDRCRRE